MIKHTSHSARRPLQLFGLWLGIGWLLVAALIYASLTPAPPQIDVEGGDKLGHILSYAVIMGWFVQLYARTMHLRFAAGFIALGISLEFIQGGTGYRSFEYLDMLANTAGVCVGWLAGRTVLAQTLFRVERHLVR